eukprot:TRINITY_DN31817_c0_g1_i1.p1 TRINITY_DN31817_c0_g1~~TRINITY_DN31817_c0_g1_i1.p1  ORF type:complete len:161 (+),score=29.98 TRINITY_DN31817_c0_g1_i1:123-605(+)
MCIRDREFHTLVNIPNGKSGMLFGAMIDIIMYGQNASTLNSLEGCWHSYSPPGTPFPGSLLLGTGSEDYPESAFYFNAGPYRADTSGLTVFEQGGSQSRVSFYKLHHQDPIFFRDGFKFEWRNGDVSDPKTGEKCTQLEGELIGSVSVANVSSLVYLYVW